MDTIIRDEAHELIDLVLKYASKESGKMLLGHINNTLYDDMIRNGATMDELRTLSELLNDVGTLYFD